ncbi:MAG TPA: hypothetical protein VK250_11035 [Nitrososphaeraceae archaeon]|nr:hypothetical protein [Nitrososphaeraceae archaeon]
MKVADHPSNVGVGLLVRESKKPALKPIGIKLNHPLITKSSVSQLAIDIVGLGA